MRVSINNSIYKYVYESTCVYIDRLQGWLHLLLEAAALDVSDFNRFCSDAHGGLRRWKAQVVEIRIHPGLQPAGARPKQHKNVLCIRVKSVITIARTPRKDCNGRKLSRP